MHPCSVIQSDLTPHLIAVDAATDRFAGMWTGRMFGNNVNAAYLSVVESFAGVRCRMQIQQRDRAA